MTKYNFNLETFKFKAMNYNNSSSDNESVHTNDTTHFKFSNTPDCTLVRDYEKFFNAKLFCDIKFIVGTEEIEIMAHIAFVAARSEYLRTKILAARYEKQQLFLMRDIDKEEPPLEIVLSNANPEAFQIILNYIYTDRIDLKEPYDKNIIILITDIYQLADLFLMRSLMDDCMDYVMTKINKQNILEALIYADQKKIKIVKDICLKYLNNKQEILTDVVMSDAFCDLEKLLLVEIMRNKLSPTKIVSDVDNKINEGTDLISDMHTFLKISGKDLADMDLVLEGHTIKVHKSILCARTQYFQAMFNLLMPAENKVNISIGDILPSVDAFQTLLRYIYYGETEFPPQDALYLLKASNFYGLSNNRLHSFCIDKLEHNITYDNVLETLEASNHTKNFDIKTYALKLIAQDIAGIARQPKFSTLSRELLLEIISAAHGALE